MMFPKPTVWRSRKYLDYVKSLPCCVCQFPADDPHHEQAEGQGGIGTRPSDERTLPLCRVHHDMRQHGSQGRMIWAWWEVDPEAAILDTQAAWYAKFKSRPWLAP